MYLNVLKHIAITSLFISFSTLTFSQITYENAFPNLTFRFPVEIQNTGVPGDDRLFVVEQEGRIKVFNNDANVTSSNTFLDITNEVDYDAGQEKGLLGLAFHPDYEQNGYFYVYLTDISGGLVEIVIKRFEVSAGNPNTANASSGCEVIAFVKNQNNSNHNGGKITFGPDGYLYASVGDGGGGGDPQNNAQNNTNLFGTILRIDVDTNCPGYAIPPDNPFVGVSGADEIYAWGIRNTWKMNFDFATNLLWAGDVGQNQFEEINLIENGGNYGWDRYEGNIIYTTSTPEPANPVAPIYTYNRSQGDKSITGGYVYRGSQISSTNPDIYGKYVFADYITGRVWVLDYDPITGSANRTLLFSAESQGGGNVFVSTFGEDINQELYFAGYGQDGVIYRLKDGFSSPTATAVNGVGFWCNPASIGTDGTVNAIASDDNSNVYIGGTFNTVGGTSVQNIARWNGSNWSTLNTGANGTIYALALTSNGDLYAGGNFTEIGGVNANNIARWNGSTWQALDNGTDGPVLTIAVDANDGVYIGGTFEQVNGITANNIALRNGNSWSALTDSGTGVAGTGNEIRSIAIDENNVAYIGGNFASAGGKTASRIATWNGSIWGTLGAGTSGFVQAIEITSDYVYAGGNFALAGGNTVNRIARWNRNTNQWQKIENGLSNNVNALTYRDGYLYAAGSFKAALNNAPQQNIIVNGLTRWSAANGWEALGTNTNVGVDNLLNALDYGSNELYIGGTFNAAGVENVSNFACWQDNIIPGQPCEDGDICTQGETYDANLNCTGGVYFDTDNDGICDNLDVCEGFNDAFDADGDGIPNGCDTDCDCTSIVPVTISQAIINGNDDVEENSSNGSINFTSGDLDIVYDEDNTNLVYNIGLRFQNLNVPFGAIVSNAYIQFTADEASSATANFNISMEDNTNSPAISNNTFNLSNRNFLTTTVNWNNVPAWNSVGDSGANQRTPNLSPLLNSIISKQGWESGNALTFRIQGDGSRIADTYDGSENNAPRLVITYQLPCIDENNNGIADICDAQCLQTDIKVILQAAYDSLANEMTTQLATGRKILPGQTPTSGLATPTPAGQPYNLAPWNYSGNEGADFTDTDYDNLSVDWILLSLRKDINKSDQITQTAALLQKDGSLRFMDNCPLEVMSDGPFYIVVEHRNHMAAMSPNLISVQNGVLTYDFTTQDSYTGDAGFGQIELAPGIWGMYTGDIRQDADSESYDINALDKAVWDVNNGQFDEYIPADLNFDGDINGQDKAIWLRNNGVSSRVPKD